MNPMDTNNDKDKIEIADRFLGAVRARQWDALASLIEQEAVWSMPGTSLISGDARGAEAVVQRWQLIVTYGMRFELMRVLVGLHGVALSLHNTAQHGEGTFDQQLVTTLTLRSGKVSALDTYMSDVEMVNAFFVPDAE